VAVSTVSAGCLATLEQAECAWDDGAASVFAGLDLEVRAGELLVVLGKNGAGKSTLLRALAGLLPLRQGRATLGGVDCRQLDPRARALRAALVPQELPPLDDVLVFDFVLAGRYARLPRWRAAPEADLAATQAALAACDAAEAACATLGTLSGGARRRVLVARALAQGAPLLLADEPTNALDPEHRLQVFDLLARAAREGRVGSGRTVRRPHRVAGWWTHQRPRPSSRSLVSRDFDAGVRRAARLCERQWRPAGVARALPS